MRLIETQEAKRLWRLNVSVHGDGVKGRLQGGKGKGKERKRMRRSRVAERASREGRRGAAVISWAAFWTQSSSSASSLQLFQRYHRHSLTNFNSTIASHDSMLLTVADFGELGPNFLEEAADCMKFQPFLGWRLASTTHYSKIITRAQFSHM